MACFKGKKKFQKDGIMIRGFSRITIDDGDGNLVGDSGWNQNVVVNEGFDDYLCRLLAGTTDSKQIGFLALGEGTKPGAADTGLDSEIMNSTQRKAPTVTVTSSKTLRFTATFYSTDSFVTAQETLKNVGLFEASAANALFAGNTYSQSTCNTNQNVNVTYDIEFS